MIQITEQEYKRMKRDEAKLNALENWGVDNWEWYWEAMKTYNLEVEYEEKMESIMQDIEVALMEWAYEPSERWAWYCAAEESRISAFDILKNGIKELNRILEQNK